MVVGYLILGVFDQESLRLLTSYYWWFIDHLDINSMAQEVCSVTSINLIIICKIVPSSTKFISHSAGRRRLIPTKEIYRKGPHHRRFFIVVIIIWSNSMISSYSILTRIGSTVALSYSSKINLPFWSIVIVIPLYPKLTLNDEFIHFYDWIVFFHYMNGT